MSDSVPAPDFNPQPDPPGAQGSDEEAVESSPQPFPPGPSASPSEQDEAVPEADQ